MSEKRPFKQAGKGPQKPIKKPFRKASPPSSDGHGGSVWLYGQHAVMSAWQNPERRCFRLLLADGSEPLPLDGIKAKRPAPQFIPKAEFDQMFEGAVHQGIAVEVALLPIPSIQDIVRDCAHDASARVVLLDQVSDPHNVGAILRSAAAFGAKAVILPDRSAPLPVGVLAKVACGAVDVVPLVPVPNLSRAMELLKESGFWTVGLDERGEKTLADANLKDGKIALVLGAEGDGLRRLTAEKCDFLVRLPTQPPIASLNVSNAAAVALYEMVR